MITGRAPLAQRTRPVSGRRTERGFSILELSVTVTLLLVSMSFFYGMMISASRSGMFVESRNDLAMLGQRVVNGVALEVSQSRLVFEEDSIGSGYRTLFTNALPTGTEIWSGSRMPIIDSNTGTIGPDPGPNNIPNRTGNCLLVARQLAPVAVPYDHDANTGTPDVNFLADLYEFQFYFLRKNAARSFGGIGFYLDPVRAKSEVFADYFQISSVTTNRAQLVQRLQTATSATMAWDVGKNVGAPAFYTLSATGTLDATIPTAFRVTLTSLCPELTGGRIAGKMEYSVAPNSGTSLPIRDPVPRLATANGDFPGGLEFQVVGPSGNRKIMTRLVLAAWYGGQFNSNEASGVTASHGF